MPFLCDEYTCKVYMYSSDLYLTKSYRSSSIELYSRGAIVVLMLKRTLNFHGQPCHLSSVTLYALYIFIVCSAFTAFTVTFRRHCKLFAYGSYDRKLYRISSTIKRFSIACRILFKASIEIKLQQIRNKDFKYCDW